MGRGFTLIYRFKIALIDQFAVCAQASTWSSAPLPDSDAENTGELRNITLNGIIFPQRPFRSRMPRQQAAASGKRNTTRTQGRIAGAESFRRKRPHPIGCMQELPYRAKSICC
jgi:hypothetical protein